ncbi:hypothetical protein ACHAXA_001822 [Cyclostephanos tholiformis]|uniref:J domain-containing protein n=1 Tax=Cyclostephanos tholiformis TaxID=382380 RepID=A0ABD3R9P9_9STRA
MSSLVASSSTMPNSLRSSAVSLSSLNSTRSHQSTAAASTSSPPVAPIRPASSSSSSSVASASVSSMRSRGGGGGGGGEASTSAVSVSSVNSARSRRSLASSSSSSSSAAHAAVVNTSSTSIPPPKTASSSSVASVSSVRSRASNTSSMAASVAASYASSRVSRSSSIAPDCASMSTVGASNVRRTHDPTSILDDIGGSIPSLTSALERELRRSKASGSSDISLAMLYVRRSDAFLDMGAYDASARDARLALECAKSISSSSSSASTSSKPYHRSSIDGAATIRTTLARSLALCALGYSLLGAGRDPDEIAVAFEESASVARWGLDDITDDRDAVDKRSLRDVVARATAGTSSLKEFRALRARLRRDVGRDVEALDMALGISPGDLELHLSKVKYLMRSRRWHDIANHCERLAAKAARWEGMFRDGDLTDVDPLIGSSSPPLGTAFVNSIRERMPALVELRSDFFAENSDDDNRSVPPHQRMLSPKAARDAVFRLPYDLLLHYLRALRLEERFEAATVAGKALLDFIDGAKVVGNDARAVNHCLRVEFDKLERTIKLKDEANALFRDGHYDSALVRYGQVLAIDGDSGRRAGPARSILRQPSRAVATATANPAGGRLHAVLHSNRSACFSAMGKQEEAIREASHAIEIHPTYMKAILRRGKCNAMVGQLEMARADYGRYVSLVEEAMRQRGSNQYPRSNQGSACYFDLPSNVSVSQLEVVKREMKSLIGEQPPAREINARERTGGRWIRRTGRGRRRKLWWTKPNGCWFCQKDVRSHVVPQPSHQPPAADDAQRRRKVTFSAPSVSSIPPHLIPPPQSFPPKQPNDNSYPSLVKLRPAFDRPLDAPSAIDPGVDYYAVLGLTIDASESDIKRAYHTLARMYHPDRNKSEEAILLFQDISFAHTILVDTKGKRREYDNARKGLLDP